MTGGRDPIDWYRSWLVENAERRLGSIIEAGGRDADDDPQRALGTGLAMLRELLVSLSRSFDLDDPHIDHSLTQQDVHERLTLPGSIPELTARTLLREARAATLPTRWLRDRFEANTGVAVVGEVDPDHPETTIVRHPGITVVVYRYESIAQLGPVLSDLVGTDVEIPERNLSREKPFAAEIRSAVSIHYDRPELREAFARPRTAGSSATTRTARPTGCPEGPARNTSQAQRPLVIGTRPCPLRA